MNKPLTREEWLTYLDTTWKKCLADAWQKEWDDMNRENIIRMAREAGFATSWTEAAGEALERFADLVAAAEREACAAVARQWDADHPASNYGGCIANLIEARGQA